MEVFPKSGGTPKSSKSSIYGNFYYKPVILGYLHDFGKPHEDLQPSPATSGAEEPLDWKTTTWSTCKYIL